MTNNKFEGLSKMLGGAMWVVICGFAGLCITGYFMLDSKAVAQDKTNSQEHIKIRKEIKEGDDKTRVQLEAKVDYFIKEQTALKIQNAQILEMVKYLKENSD